MPSRPQPSPVLEDELLNLEMNVARRADALARGASRDRGSDLAHWLQAEREVLADRLPPATARR